MNMERIGQQARAAADALRPMTSAVKDAALIGIAERMAASSNRLKAENAKDLEAGRAKGLSAAMLDRLELNDTRIAAMADGLRAVAALPDPVGEILHQTVRPNGLRIARIRQPIGVVG
ncbi:MAG TPA: gamma-glutamyl-phosphate reductase, partial [Candidatus Hydrogenedentes bacterium]|nr:gamma-glutamyl-phosphate reductase [Candidatus Hydrogenedentota bacterium]